jgi:hypothetical protein
MGGLLGLAGLERESVGEGNVLLFLLVLGGIKRKH